MTTSTPIYGATPTGSVDELRYPIGPLNPTRSLSPAERATEIARIARAPAAIRQAVEDLSDAQLDTPYRDGGWTIRQVVHHLADSHMNAYVRLKLALTEDNPTIKPYDEARWAELSDSRTLPIEVSLRLLETLHERFIATLRSMQPADFGRTFYHPEHRRELTVDELVGMYAWHGEHHTAHVTRASQRLGWKKGPRT
jgi:uncharacterized damage-inducible protein DinB